MSLQRRKPALSPEIQSLSEQLLPLQSNPVQDVDTYLRCTLARLCLGTNSMDNALPTPNTAADFPLPTGSTPDRPTVARWEPLAVGLHLSVAFLQAYRRRIDDSQSADAVFMDGPRVPAVLPTAAPPPPPPPPPPKRPSDMNGSASPGSARS